MLSSSGGSREGISPALLSSFIATGSFTLHIFEFYLFIYLSKLECIFFRILNQRQTLKSLKVMHHMLRCTDVHVCKRASAGICATVKVIVAGFWRWEEQGIEYKAQRLIWVIDNQNMLRDVKTITKRKHGWPNTLGKKQTHTREGTEGDF